MRSTGIRRFPLLLGAVGLAMGFLSCEPIYDAAPDCRLGINLRFVYDYHMEPGANAFPANVDCVNVLVFDPEGKYLTQFVETSDALQDEDYRMGIPLDPGEYRLVVYGGTACEDTSFDLTPDWNSAEGRSAVREDIRATLPLKDGICSDTQLHDIVERTGGLFFGTLDVSLTEDDIASTFREETVYLMKDTNDIQIILQELSSPYSVDYKDYEFRIIDDNFILDGRNKAVEIATEDFQPFYAPFNSENRVMGYVEPAAREGVLLTEDEARPVQVACAEFSTSRLLVEHMSSARLVVTTAVQEESGEEPRTVIDIPLLVYLSAIRGFGDRWIKDDQEFLDRQSRWTLMFFLQRNVWVKTTISVNWWTVRINDIELG